MNISEIKNNKIKKLEIGMIIIVLSLVLLWLGVKLLGQLEEEQYTKVIQNGRDFTSELLNDYNNSDKKSYDIEQSAKKVVEKLNSTHKNPMNNKNSAFNFNEKCKGCINVVFDGNTKSITITGYDKNEKLLIRSVVQPPSFVTYEKNKNE